MNDDESVPADPVVVALDVGGTGMKCAVVRPDGVAVRTERHPTNAARGPAAVIGTILDVAEGLADKARADGFTPVALGIAVPGVVDEVRGVAVWSANVGFRGVPLRDLAVARLGLPTATTPRVTTTTTWATRSIDERRSRCAQDPRPKTSHRTSSGSAC